MKNIIHMKIPTVAQDTFAVSHAVLANIAEQARAALPEDYILLITPFDTTMIDGDAMIINIDCREYSYNELKEIIERSHVSK